ncbi:Na/Pi symporter [Xanthobacter sp. DSM 24535]|uniref:Na/Pi symporter n=1 Tax=Roseixanthobacter psychrophilus TaxID=3119917 RepID=UPI00372B5CF4
MLILAGLLAGLGLLFIGLKLMSVHLQQAMGRRVRTMLKAATRSSISGFFCGAFAGAGAQSSNAVTLIAGNLVRGGVFTTRDAIPVVAGANVGTSALVFIASIDMRIAVLFLIALVGMTYQLRLDRRPSWRDWMGVTLGLALLFLGLDFIKSAPKGIDVAEAAAAFSNGITPLLGLALGFVVAVITQSASTATILAVAATHAHMLGLEDAFYLILGANFGSGIATLLTSGGLVGIGKQLCFVHILVKGVGCIIVFAVWQAANLAGWDSPAILARLGGGEPALSISLLFLALQVSGGLVVTGLRGLSEKIAVALSPASVEDRVSRPHFIHDSAIRDPSTALDLAARETDRLVSLLPDLLPDLDQRTAGAAKERSVLWHGSTSIAATTGQFVVRVIERRLGREDLDLALHIQEQLDIVKFLQDTLHEFSDVVEEFKDVPPLAFNLSEALRTIVLSLVDARDGSGEDFDILIALTADRSDLLDRIRRALAASSLGSGEDARKLLLATSMFERAVWLVRRLAVALRPDANGDKSAAAPKTANLEVAHAD